MSVTPTGIMSKDVAALRSMLSECAAFRTWVNVATPALALPFIHVISTGRNPVLPMALIDIGDWSRTRSVVFSGQKFDFAPGASLVLYLRAAATEDEPDAAYRFMNAAGAIIEDLEKLSSTQAKGWPTIPTITLVAAPSRIEPSKRESVGDYYECAFTIDRGVRP